MAADLSFQGLVGFRQFARAMQNPQFQFFVRLSQNVLGPSPDRDIRHGGATTGGVLVVHNRRGAFQLNI